jgi:hypothetical protein
MKTTLLLLFSLVLASASALEPPPPPSAEAAEQTEQKFITLTLALPASGQPGQVGEAPPALQALIKQGWRVAQCTTLGKTGDNGGVVVALVLEQSSADHDPQAAAPGGDGPGAAAPVSAAKPGTYHIAWDDGYETVAVIAAAVGSRNPVSVTTKEKDGKAVVTYAATAFLDAQGTLHIDGRGAPLSGPLATAYSPDSFAIHADGTVVIRDDHGNDEKGVLISDAPGAAPGQGAAGPAKSNL